MISFVTSLFNGWREDVYKPEHVYRMQQMIQQHYKRPHRFFCITDEKLEGIETVPMWECPMPQIKGIPSSHFRLFLFSGQARSIFGHKIVNIDLDAIILKNITSLFTADTFKIVKGISNPYNGSLWQITPGAYPELWTDLNAKTAWAANRKRTDEGRAYYGSDQAVMAYKLPGAPTWDQEDGIFHYNGSIPEQARILFFTGLQKPWMTRHSGLYWGDEKVCSNG